MLTFVEQTNPILNRPARLLSPADLATDEIQQQIDAMLAFAGGLTRPAQDKGRRLVGLAAPQVGIDAAIILVDQVRDEEWSGDLMVLVNPLITNQRGEKMRWWHGCYSTAPICGILELPSIMDVAALDRYGGPLITTLQGRLQTHVLWHEVSHINGQRFPDEVLRQGNPLLTVYGHEFPMFDIDRPWHRVTPPEAWYAMKAGRPWTHLL